VSERLVPVLLLTLGGLCWFAWVEWNEQPRVAGPGASGVAPGLAVEPYQPPVADPVAPLADLSETLQRPLFTPERRPAQDEPAPVVAPATDLPRTPPSFELTAVVLANGERVALLKALGAGQLHRLRQGESVDGWTLTEVRPDGVVLERGGQRESIELRTFDAPRVRGREPAAADRRRDRARSDDDDAETAPRRVRRPTRRTVRRRTQEP
jgi:hypothetical protein